MDPTITPTRTVALTPTTARVVRLTPRPLVSPTLRVMAAAATAADRAVPRIRAMTGVILDQADLGQMVCVSGL